MAGLEPGTVVHQRYEVLGQIGAGGMGAVYRARDLHADTVVALKQMIARNQAEHIYFSQRFEQEARFLESLDHPRIPRIIDYFVEGHSSFLVMEYIAGKSLFHILHEKRQSGQRFAPTEVIRYAIQLCDVLDYLHSRPQPLIHRDIKPENVIVREGTDQIVLVDFGIARGVDTSSTKTQIGTMGYAPLEQVRGHPEPRSDLYALGASMHHLLSGTPPQPFQLAPLSTVEPPLPEGLIEAVERATQNLPANRYISASRMKRSLMELLAELDPTARVDLPVASPKARNELEQFMETQNAKASQTLFITLLIVVVVASTFAIAIMASFRDEIDRQPPRPVQNTHIETITFPQPPARPGEQRVRAVPIEARYVPGKVDETQARALRGWFETPEVADNWQPVSCQNLLPSGILHANPGETAGVVFSRRAQKPMSRMSFRAIRNQGRPGYLVQFGELGVRTASSDDGSQVNLLGADGSASDYLQVKGVQPYGPLNVLMLKPGTLKLSVEGFAGKVTLNQEAGRTDRLAIILEPSNQVQELEFRDFDFR
ncbi:MAG: serine/threonine protein kinase [Candidatus Eremiobacteraeota bacterium]|nr:serine/threonine protein kinase [Candidatus Eremiobacteraeota bacterium]